MRLGSRRSQVEGEVTKNLTGCGMVGEEKAIEEDDSLHSIAWRTGRGSDRIFPSSRYRVIAWHLHRDRSPHNLEQDTNATGIIEPVENAKLVGERTRNETNL